VQAVFEVKFALPADHVREQVAIEGGVLGQDGMQVKHVLCGDELVKAYGTRRYLGPFT
jgi:hypothetical protein